MRAKCDMNEILVNTDETGYDYGKLRLTVI